MATAQCIVMPRPTVKIDRIKIGRAFVDVTSFSETLDILVEHASARKPPLYVVTPNAQHVVMLEDDAQFREVYEHAALVLPDGASLLGAARILGAKLRERITGIDLFQGLCERAAQKGLRVFLLGGRPGAADLAVKKLRARYPNLIVAGTCRPPDAFDKNEELLRGVAQTIREAHPHFLFVGLGARMQENWMYQHGRKLGVPVSIGVGGSFDVVSGLLPRAPRWMQDCGFEWLFRIAAEPRRLWKRYLIGNSRFIAIVLRQLMTAGIHSGPVHTGAGGEI
jgi:N-acetylglucosaminyldiphosphoundecaprenol N-acetyl-beta-D-mannosaminyltransferase